MRIGIDFGTSNSSAARYSNHAAALLPLDPAARDPHVVRSLLYLSRDGRRPIGQPALDAYYQGDTGRTVQLQRIRAGMLENIFAEVGTIHTAIYVWEDTNAPGREDYSSLIASRSSALKRSAGTASVRAITRTLCSHS